MKINYYDYNNSYLKKIVNNTEEKSVYIFKNYKTMEKAEEYDNSSFLSKKNKFIILQDFKNMISPPSKIILKEEKLTAIFYQLLKEDEKQLLNVSDYFDVIEISSKFYSFFAELEAEYPDKNLNELKKELFKTIDIKKWQKEKLQIFFKVKKRYNEYMNKRNFSDKNSAFSKNNFDNYFIKDYKNIIFVNKLYFTKKEKSLISFLEKNHNVILNLQLKSDDFSEKDLKLVDFTLPDNYNKNLKLFSLKENLLQLVNAIMSYKNSEEKQIEILDCDFKNNNYHKFLNKKLINAEKNTSFTESEIYNYLEYLRLIFNKRDRKSNFLKIELAPFLKAVNNDFFSKYYGITSSEIKELNKLKGENFVYISEKLIKKREINSILKIFDDIKAIEKITNFTDFISFLEQIKINKLNTKKYKNDFEIYNYSIFEIKALEKLDIVKDWNNLFSDLSSGILKFFLNYLRYKELKDFNLYDNEKEKYKICDFNNSAEKMRKNLIVINASSNILAQNENDFLLTNKQREKLALKNVEEKNLIEKYIFMRNILTSENSLVFANKSLEENISESSHMEELALKYNLEIKEADLSEENLNEVIHGIFNFQNQKIQNYSQRKFPINFKKEKLKMEKRDFSKLSSLSYYRYNRIKDCQYRYFLEFLVGLEKDEIEVDNQINVMVFGSIVHEIFAKTARLKNIKNGLDNEKINKIIDEVLDSYDLKINNYFEKYYNKILFNKVKESIRNFLNGLKKRIRENIKEIYTELSLKKWREINNFLDKNNIFYKSKYSDFYLNGRVDFLAITDKMNYIIDFKTGGSNTEQLDLYELMLFSENNKIETKKMIYSVIEEKFKSSYKSKEKFSSDLKEELDNFIEKSYYTRIYKSRCNNCPYSDICKVVRK